MRTWLGVAVLAFLPDAVAAQSCTLRWPDPEIALPAEVALFIAAECRAGRGTSEESEAACVEAESYGYRAQVTMLTDARLGAAAADLYRACRQGLGTEGGRFHRRRAECIGGSLGIAWRYEFMRKAALDGRDAVEFAQGAVPATHDRF